MEKSRCETCSGESTLIFSCSGGADVGALADLTARELTKRKTGKMFCLAGIGGKVNSIIDTTKKADNLIVVDGCPVDCAYKTLKSAGLIDMIHLRLTDHGFQKGKTNLDSDSIIDAANIVDKMINSLNE